MPARSGNSNFRHVIGQAYRQSAMKKVSQDILGCIGNTSLLPLRKIVPKNGARILLKIESENPTGSMKDRMALAMIEAAEADGRLMRGGAVVEYTGGGTGVSLALVCAGKGYPIHIVSSDAFSQEKLDHMKILGAELQIVRSESGGMTEKLTRDMVEAARVITEQTGGFWTDQLKNTDQLTAYHAMADEIWNQAEGKIDGFVQMVRTAASLRGIAERLRSHKDQIRIAAVEPSESAVLSGGKPGAHKIDGVGAGFVVPLWEERIADQIEQVSTDEATAMALWLAREERPIRRHVHRRKCHRSSAIGRATGTRCDDCHRDVRHWDEVPQDISRKASLKPRLLVPAVAYFLKIPIDTAKNVHINEARDAGHSCARSKLPKCPTRCRDQDDFANPQPFDRHCRKVLFLKIAGRVNNRHLPIMPNDRVPENRQLTLKLIGRWTPV
jgi:cysteine synthase A